MGNRVRNQLPSAVKRNQTLNHLQRRRGIELGVDIAARKDHRHAVMDSGHERIGLGRDDGEGHRGCFAFCRSISCHLKDPLTSTRHRHFLAAARNIGLSKIVCPIALTGCSLEKSFAHRCTNPHPALLGGITFAALYRFVLDWYLTSGIR